MWKGSSHILATPTNLVGVGRKKFKWTEVQQKAFEDIKRNMAKKTIIIYQNFNEIFEIYIDVSYRQLGTVIFHRKKKV